MIPELSIIIVHWNTPDLLVKCISSIYNHEKELAYEVIIIDNASETTIDENLFALTDKIKCIKLIDNIGFGQACNRGVSIAQGDCLLFLGADVEIVKKNTILNTLRKMKEINKVGAFSCRLLNSDGTGQRHWFKFPRADKVVFEYMINMLNYLPFIHSYRKKKQPKILEAVDMVIAHWLMTSKKTFLDVGCFPEGAFMFGDDIELNKAFIDHGCRNYVYRGECAVHIGGQSTKQRYKSKLTYVVQDSIARFAFKHYGFWGGIASLCAYLLCSICNIVLLIPFSCQRRKREYIVANLRIVMYYVYYFWNPGTIRKISGAE